MKYATSVFLSFLLIAIYGCNDSGSNSIDSTNRCFSITSDSPCFDQELTGSTSIIDDRSSDEVIAELENSPGFNDQLDVTEIARTIGYSIFLPPLSPDCRWEESGIVINTQDDWNRFRNNCFFKDNFFEFPDIDFTQDMVLVSYQNSAGFGTRIVAVLEFGSELLVVIEDRVSDVPAQSLGFPSYIGKVQKKDLVSNFIRVKDICSSFFNLSNSECLAQSLTNICEPSVCGFRGGHFVTSEPNCSVLDCASLQCDNIEVIIGFKLETVSGTITDLQVGENGIPLGFINIEGEDFEVGCGIVVE